MHNFQGEVAQPVVGPSLGEQPMRGMNQVMTDRLPLCKKDTKACELDEVRKATIKVGRKAQK